MNWSAKKFFPCPLCLSPLDVRQSKKRRPYVCCDACGVQLFVRNESGMRMFERLVQEHDQRDVWTRLADLQEKYQKTCPECGRRFWINHRSIATNWLDGKLLGYRCPEPDCKGIVEAEDQL